MQMPAPAVLVGQDETVAGRHRAPRRRNRDLEQCLCVDVSRFPPIEARVGDDDLDAGYEQRQKAQSRNPMSDADDRAMPRPRRSGGSYCRIGHSRIISLSYPQRQTRSCVVDGVPVKYPAIASSILECPGARRPQHYSHSTTPYDATARLFAGSPSLFAPSKRCIVAVLAAPPQYREERSASADVFNGYHVRRGAPGDWWPGSIRLWPFNSMGIDYLNIDYCFAPVPLSSSCGLALVQIDPVHFVVSMEYRCAICSGSAN